jgi:2-haloacid dehalogenase
LAKSPPNLQILVFDVNETLLNLAGLRPEFIRIFGDDAALKEWFGLLLQYSLITTVIETYSDFGVLGRAVLQMLSQARGVSLSTKDEDRVLHGMQSLPPHPEVPGALERLRKSGFRLATLTNSSPSMVQAQLKNAGLSDFFEHTISVEEVHRFKPHVSVYEHAAKRLNVPASGACLVAAHAWDILGAMHAGWSAAFVARPGKVLFPLSAKPSMVATDMNQLATLLIEKL